MYYQLQNYYLLSSEQGDPWNDGGTKDFILSIALSEGGPFTEVVLSLKKLGIFIKLSFSLAITFNVYAFINMF